METVNITALRNDVYNVVSKVVKYNSVYNVTSREGDAVLISRAEYENMKEMEFFDARPKLKEELLESLHASDSDFINEDDLEW